MSPSSDIFLGALTTILREIFDGPGQEGFLLNPGDPGLLRQLDAISAADASRRPMPGQTTIAAHVDHVHYGLTLLNRWAGGEANPWATADWDASWKRGVVTDAQWTQLRSDLRKESAAWQAAVTQPREWIPLTASGAIASAAHTAYHLGAIRQILAALNDRA